MGDALEFRVERDDQQRYTMSQRRKHGGFSPLQRKVLRGNLDRASFELAMQRYTTDLMLQLRTFSVTVIGEDMPQL